MCRKKDLKFTSQNDKAQGNPEKNPYPSYK